MWTRTPTDPSTRAAERALGYLTRRGDRRAIARGCEDLGLEMTRVVRERDGDHTRPGLTHALDQVAAGKAACLVVRRLEDLGAEVDGLAPVLDRIDDEDIRVVALDVGLDTASEAGRMALERRPLRDLAWLVPVKDAVEDAPDERVEDAGPAETAAPADDPPREVPELVDTPQPVDEPRPVEAPEPVDEPRPVEAPEPVDQPRPVEVPEPVDEPPDDGEPVDAAGPVDEADAEPAPAPPAPAAAPGAEPAVFAVGYASAGGTKEGAAQDLAAQREAIERSCRAHGLQLLELVGDREPRDGKALDRPGFSHAVQRIAACEASCLVVGGLERLSRSVAELGQLVRWLESRQVRLIAIDLGLDTATEAGRTTARALAAVADWERERLSERTRKGLAAARAKRHSGAGANAGEWAALHRRIAAMRADGMTLQAIADVLNEEGVPTQRGGAKWRPSSVQSAAGYRRPSRSRSAERLPRQGADPPPEPDH